MLSKPCASRGRLTQPTSDLRDKKPFGIHSRAHPSSPAYDEFRSSLPSSVPFTQGHSPKTRPPRKAVLTGQARALRMSSRHHIWLILRVQAWHLRDLHALAFAAHVPLRNRCSSPRALHQTYTMASRPAHPTPFTAVQAPACALAGSCPAQTHSPHRLQTPRFFSIT